MADYYSDQQGDYGMPDMSNGGGGPNGIPDPTNPGYDTAGYPLVWNSAPGGSGPGLDNDTPGGDPGGGPAGPMTPDPRIPRAPVPSPGPGEPVVPSPPPPGPAPAPTDWQGLQQSIFGSMPSVGAATPPPFQYDPWNAPAAFAPPSANDVLYSDPGFGFRRDQGTQAMQQSAAARGVLNTGGTLQDLVDYGQKAASQEYGQAYNRALGTYDENYRNGLNSYITNFGNALTKYNTNYGTQYLTPYNQLMQQYGQGVNNQAQLFGQQFQTATA